MACFIDVMPSALTILAPIRNAVYLIKYPYMFCVGIRSSQALSSSRVLNINMLVKSRPIIGFRCFSTTHIKLTQETTDSSKFDVTDEDDFEKKVLKSVLPVVVDFHAE